MNLERLTDLPQVEGKWQSQDAPQIYTTQSQSSLTPDTAEQQSHGTHCIFSCRAQGQPSAGCRASALTPLYPISHWDCFLCTPVPGHQQLQGRLLILQDLCTHSDSAHRVLEAAHNNGDGNPVTSTLPRHLWPWGTHKSKNEKNQMWSLSRLLCSDFLEVWSGSQEVLD